MIQYIWCDPDKVFTGTLANYVQTQEIKDRNYNRLITLHTGEAQSPDRNGFIERYILVTSLDISFLLTFYHLCLTPEINTIENTTLRETVERRSLLILCV